MKVAFFCQNDKVCPIINGNSNLHRLLVSKHPLLDYKKCRVNTLNWLNKKDLLSSIIYIIGLNFNVRDFKRLNDM